MWDAFHCVVLGAKVLRTRSFNLCFVSDFVELFVMFKIMSCCAWGCISLYLCEEQVY